MKARELLHSSTFRLAIFYMTLFAGSVLLLLGFIYWSTVAFMAQQIDTTIEADIQGLSEQYRERGLEGLVQTINARVERDPDSSSVFLLTSPTYTPLAGNLSAWPNEPPKEDSWLSFEFKDPRADGRVFQARAKPFVLQNGLRLLVGRDMRELKATEQLIVRALLWGIAITLVLALAGGIAMSRRSLGRIEQINQISREIMAGDLSRRIPAGGHEDDFDQLAANLNAMLDEIQRLMEGIRHVSDSVAHDLRTPLTRLRNRLEGLRTELQHDGAPLDAVERSLADTDQLLSTFSALLRIARIEAGGQPLRFAPIALGGLLTDAMELYEAVAEKQGLVMDLDLTDCPPVMGDRDLLFQAVANLLDNAIKYTPDGGKIRLGLKCAGAGIDLTISDNGPGIPAKERNKVLQRFYRLEQSRSSPGSGLGLSLVAAVAQRHRATLQLDDNFPGLRATLHFNSTA